MCARTIRVSRYEAIPLPLETENYILGIFTVISSFLTFVFDAHSQA